MHQKQLRVQYLFPSSFFLLDACFWSQNVKQLGLKIALSWQPLLRWTNDTFFHLWGAILGPSFNYCLSVFCIMWKCCLLWLCWEWACDDGWPMTAAQICLQVQIKYPEPGSQSQTFSMLDDPWSLLIHNHPSSCAELRTENLEDF